MNRDMDFGEGRITYSGLSTEYYESEMKRKITDSLEYIVAYYEGEAFVVQCFRKLAGTKPGKLEKEKYLGFLNSGVSKEAVCYRLMFEKNAFESITDKTRRLYKKRFLEAEWDISDVLKFEGGAFVKACYQTILNREPDEAGYVNYCSLLMNGTPKEAILYMLGASEEAKKIQKIKNLNVYKDVHDNWIKDTQNQRSETKVDKLKRPLRTYEIVRRMENQQNELAIKLDYRNEQISACLRHIMEQNNYLINRITELENQISELKSVNK